MRGGLGAVAAPGLKGRRVLQCLLFAVALLRGAWASGQPGGNMFGVVTKDTVFLTTTSTFHGPSGVLMRSDMDWITPLAGQRTLLGLRGDPSDCDYLRGQLEQVCNEHALNFNGRPLTCKAVASYCRHLIAKQLRKSPLSVEVLIAGWDDVADVPVLYWLDEVGALQKVPYAAHGKEFPFIFSVLDRADSAAGAGGGAGAVKNPKPCKLQYLEANEGLKAIQSCWKVINKRTSGYSLADHSVIKIYGVSKNGWKEYHLL